MIASPKAAGLIQNEHGVPVTFEIGWLQAALDQAARRAGYDGWWLAEEFGATVLKFLLQDGTRESIELPHLERVVRGALRDIGYRDIAVRFRMLNPFQQISLLDVLGKSGGKQEALFFTRLGERLEKSHSLRVQHLHFYDLCPCVQRLLGDEAIPAWWSKSLMQAHIVGFIRERIRRLPWQSKMQCTIR